jgi:solute carrier family 25 phosphate transporter 23/24/25/41
MTSIVTSVFGRRQSPATQTDVKKMVLRGSKTQPSVSLSKAVDELSKAEVALAEKARALADAEQNTTAQLAALRADHAKTLAEVDRVLADIEAETKRIKREHSAASAHKKKSETQLTRTMKQFAAGGIAGGVSRSVVAPIDRVKILMQTQFLLAKKQATTAAAGGGGPAVASSVGVGGGGDKYTGIVQTLRTIVKDEGVSRLWRGNGTNCLRVVPYAALQFTSYDQYKQMLLKSSHLGGVGDESVLARSKAFAPSSSASAATTAPNRELRVWERLLAGSMAGATATTFTHPLDVIRVRLATQPELHGMLDATRSILAENGARTLFKGYVPTLLSLSPFIAINFATFDTLKSIALSNVGGTSLPVFTTLSLGAASGLFAQTMC